jgi:hypothetical protein
MSRQLPEYVDIGGECFAVTDTMEPPSSEEVDSNNTNTYDLVCKSKREFQNTFSDIIKEHPNTVQLFRKYLPYGKKQLEGILNSEKEELKEIIEARRNMLKNSIEHSNQTVKSIQFIRYYDNLNLLLKSIDNVRKDSSAEELQKRIRNLSKDRIFYILLEMAWKLLHPDEIQSGTEDTWMALLDSIKSLSLGDIVETINGIKDPSRNKRIDIEQVQKATKINYVLSPPDDVDELRDRLKAILQILATKKYLKMPIPTNKKDPIINDSTLKHLSNSIQGSMIPTKTVGGSKALSGGSLYETMGPYYDFFEKKYEPITSVLSKAPMDESIFLNTLSQFLFICEKIASRSPPDHGIYRITNLDESVLSYLRSQLGAIRGYLTDPSTSDEQKEAYIAAVDLIPVVSITSLLNKFGKSGHYIDPKKLPRLQIMMVGYNMDHFPTKEDISLGGDANVGDYPKEKIYEATQKFFTKDSVYLVCTDSDSVHHHIPMNLFEIDDMYVDVVKNAMTINEVKDNYFNKYKKPAIYLETVMKIETDTTYPYAMLALSMFMASRELLPK